MSAPQKFSSFIEDLLKNEEFLEENQLTANNLRDNIVLLNKKIVNSKITIENLRKEISSLVNEENDLKIKIIISETQVKGIEQVIADLLRNKNEEQAKLEVLENNTRLRRRAFCDTALEFSENYGLVTRVQQQYQSSIREQMQMALFSEDDSSKEVTNNNLEELENSLKQRKEEHKAVQEELRNLLKLNENLEIEYLYGNTFQRLKKDLKKLNEENENLQASIKRCEMDELLSANMNSSAFYRNQRESLAFNNFKFNTGNNIERPQMQNKEDKKGKCVRKWQLYKNNTHN